MINSMRFAQISASLLAILFLLTSVQLRADAVTAESLYRDLQDRIFQIQVIDQISNKKSSIGSGFLLNAEGLIATNYHVVSEFILAPEKYRIEYLDHLGQSGVLSIQYIDVIHDLALVKGEVASQGYLELSERQLSKGAQIYAIGNPHDLGMSIIEGTYNGLLEKSQYQKILFSGSLNPGMSGGPALDEAGKVIGVNVSTAGNDLSFLVPAKYLQALVIRAPEKEGTTDFMAAIEQQLFENQQRILQSLQEATWKNIDLGPFKVPAELMNYFKCWGKTDNEEDKQYKHTYSACASSDSIYVTSQFNTGNIDFRYDWYEADKLNQFQFYTLYENKFAGSYSTNQAGKEDVTNYRCNTKFVTINQQHWKAALCFRQYKKFTRLYDLALTMALIDKPKQGLLVNVNVAGISRQNAMQFVGKYMGSIEWQQ